MPNRFGKSVCILGIALSLSLATSLHANNFYSARVKDISDRKYEPAVIELLDNARESIVISMYLISAKEKGPVSLLIRDLEEALDKGISVDIYINTRFKSGQPVKGALKKHFNRLRKKGAKIYFVTPSIRLHDKIVIIDNRYIAEGSGNWSVSALKSNREIGTLIDSPELAKERLIRMKRLPLKSAKTKKAKKPDKPKGMKPLPKNSSVSISKKLLNDKKLFPNMVTRNDNRSMDTYLLLLARAKQLKRKEFFLSLESMAVDLGMPSSRTDTALRRQVIKTLKKLQDRYKLIDVNFAHGKDTWIEIKDIPGDAFGVKGSAFNPKFLSSTPPAAKFVLLIKTMLENEGKSLDSFTKKDLYTRFHISKRTFNTALKEIE